MSASVKYLYELYYTSAINSWAFWLYNRFMRSPLVVKWLFGMKVLSPEELSSYFTTLPIYFGSQTVFLKMVLKDKLRRSPNLKLLEVGVGAFAVLSGYLSRWVTQTIDAIDIDPACIESAQKHVELNKVNVCVFYSDLFTKVSNCKYDLIFWNLPLTEDPNTYLPRLFKEVPNFMNKNAQLVIVYHTKKLQRENVLDTLSNFKRLQLNEIKTWWWSMHEVMLIDKKVTFS
jgi:hypothetical protein